MTDAFEDVDLADEWEERQQPPTLKFSACGSMSGSLNILGDTTQKWTNVNRIVSKDLLTKQTKPLTALFEPPSPLPGQMNEGLSIVVEEPTEVVRASSHDSIDRQLEQDAESDTATIKATVRSADGLIPNFSFPRSTSSCAVQPPIIKDMYIQQESDKELNLSDSSDADIRPATKGSENADITSTPKRYTHKSSASSLSPTKSPLKLFHSEQDTFTRDHTARMIGMLSAPPAPAMQALKDERKNDTQRSHESEISVMTIASDAGPERKKVKTHVPKGSVTLQNFNENADRLAAKLRAKGGGLGKGLPRVVEESKVILGRRISSAAERLDQQRKRDRSQRYNAPPPSSGFEAINIPVDQFMSEPKFGTRSSKSHFSDWESEANDQSRQVSLATQHESKQDDELAAQSINPQVMYDSVRQTWTQTPGRVTGGNRPSSAPGQNSPRQVHHRAASSTSIPSPKKSPRYKNFPPAAMETLRHGDMIFDTAKQCWRHVSDCQTEAELENETSRLTTSNRKVTRTRSWAMSESEYPDEIDLSTSTSFASTRDKQKPTMHEEPKIEAHIDAMTVTESDHSENSSQMSHEEGPSIVRHRQPPHLQQSNLVKVSQVVVSTAVESEVEELADLTADMTMSHSTGLLVSAINKRYGEGPWEHIQSIDLHALGLDSLHGLNRFFPALISLDISGNNITSLNDLPSSLQHLKAAKNKLTSHLTTFEHLTNLERLDIAGNEFEDLDGLEPLSHLHHLDVSNNRLECIDGLRHLHNLVSMQAQGNKIEEINFESLQSSMSFDHLQTIDLSSNKLSHVTGLDSLPALMDIDLSNNVLSELDVHQPMPQVKVLKASENQLSSLDLTPFPRVRVVYLDDNNLIDVNLPACVKHIEAFSMRRQNVEGVRINLDSLCEVKKLFLGGNIWPDFRLHTHFHSLKYLELAGLMLTSIPDNLATMAPNLRVLNLSNNDISDLTPLHGLSRLERLMAPNNKISRIEELSQVLGSLPRLKALDLRANPYTARFYAPIHSSHDIDYFAHLDGMRNTASVMQQWLCEDDKFVATLTDSMARRRTAYQNLIWTVCRSLRWHDGRMLETHQLLEADAFVTSFQQGEGL